MGLEDTVMKLVLRVGVRWPPASPDRVPHKTASRGHQAYPCPMKGMEMCGPIGCG